MKKVSNRKAPNVTWFPDMPEVFEDIFLSMRASRDHKPAEPKEQFIESLTNGKKTREILDLIIEYLNEHKAHYSKTHGQKYISLELKNEPEEMLEFVLACYEDINRHNISDRNMSSNLALSVEVQEDNTEVYMSFSDVFFHKVTDSDSEFIKYWRAYKKSLSEGA